MHACFSLMQKKIFLWWNSNSGGVYVLYKVEKQERKAGQRYSGGKTHDDSAHVDDGDGVDNNIWA